MRTLLSLLFIFILMQSPLFSQDLQLNQPLRVHNQFLPFQPLLQMQPESTALIPIDKNEINLSFFKGNTHIYQYNNLNQPVFIIDEETTRLEVTYRRNIGMEMELSATLPYLWNGPGFLDNFTESWHGWFGLPNGGRDLEPQDLFIIKSASYNSTTPSKGIGDPLFSLKKGFSQLPFPFALKASLQLPLSGDKFIGSGTFDLGLAALSDYYATDWLYLYGSLGITYALGSSHLETAFNYDQPLGFQWSLGFALLPFDSFSLFMQVFYQSSPYNSGYTYLDNASIMHSMGFRFKIFKDTVAQISIDEDSFAVLHGTDYTLTLVLESRF